MHDPPPFLFIRRRPVGTLAGLVDSIWHANGRVPYRTERILPNGKPVLIFNLGAPFVTADGAGASPPSVNRDAWLCGNRARYLLNRPLAETNVVGVTFHPHGAAALLGLSMREAAGRVVDADAILGGRVGETRERLFEARAPAAKIAIAEALLRRLAAAATPTPRLIRRATARLAAADPPSIAALSDELNISQKHLIDRFHHHVGLAPKTLLRVHRFERALEGLNATGEIALEQIALACGYFDQAHFNRDFAAFSGINPTAYANTRRAYFTDPSQADDTGLFVPID